VHRHPVAVLVGPTAVGKTGVALELARRLGATIVNADSLQVYRDLDIGTAKPTAAERAQAPHLLVDVAAPDEPYDAARYCREARGALADLHRREVSPLVVGGTGLYIKALLHGLFEQEPIPAAHRERLRRDLAQFGLAALYARLTQLDPDTAGRLHPHDTYRILRALETVEAGGRPLALLHRAHRFPPSPYRTLKLGLTLPREELYERIHRRVQVMLDAGWLAEVEELLRRYGPDLKPLQALGYRHLIAYLHGRWSWEEALELLRRDTRRYAKRQLTWFRGDPGIEWFHPAETAAMGARLEAFFQGE
jgi:tRNA dimethylallyltransferase